MNTLQQLLTIAIEFTAFIGFGGIVLHSIWMSHYRWCAEFMPEVMPFEEYITQAANLIKTEPAPNLNKIEPSPSLIKTEEVAVGLALNKNLDTQQLRELCDRYRIQWRHYRGKGRHMPKSVMASALASVS